MGVKTKPDLSWNYGDAGISACGAYRYWLDRHWVDRDETCGRPLQKVAFILLNPSTADADTDDPTIRRCIGFARRWGFKGMRIENLFAYRATDPTELVARCQLGVDVIGVEQDEYGNDYARLEDECAVIVFGWGRDGKLMGRGEEVARKFPGAMCLGVNGDGSPKHPLYLANETKLELYADAVKRTGGKR